MLVQIEDQGHPGRPRKTPKKVKIRIVKSGTAFFYLHAFFFPYNNQLMKVRTSLGIMLIVVLLAQTTQSFKWQAMGSGMNNTVLSEIWVNLRYNLSTAIMIGAARQFIVTGISNRLNARWSPAWNVVLTFGRNTYDTILYGYGFNNQWMWFNDVPYDNQNQPDMFTLIVWKDYNCQDWKDISSYDTETSTFTTNQKAVIRFEIDLMTETGIDNDIWGTAFTMMKKIEENSLLSSGAYSVVMSQNGQINFYGRICRVGDGFYNSYNELGNSAIFSSSKKGWFYLFQTR